MIVMFRKMALAMSVLASVMALPAAAHPPGFHFGHGCSVWWDEPCYDPFGWREEELGFRVNCDSAREIVRERGYQKVRIAKCGVRQHQMTGWRRGMKYLITVNGYNGDIWSVKRIR